MFIKLILPIYKTTLLLFSFALFLYIVVACGVNTNVPAQAIPLSYPAATKPNIESVVFVGEGDGFAFDISYYISNSEADFLGYNLYIKTIPSSVGFFLSGAGQESRYLPRGIAPSFIHVDDLVSSLPADLKVQRITYRGTPPAAEPFYNCMLYYFRIAAYLRGGFFSEVSPEIATCANANIASCPSNSPCNP